MNLLRDRTPLEDHLQDLGLLVKREDLSCAPPGPPFSKTRGVFAHVRARYAEGVRAFGVLDTYHSQAGHAVAAAVMALQDPSVRCLNFYPVYKGDEGKAVREPQARAEQLGAELMGLKAGRSAILFHTAKRLTTEAGGYMMPNALKLPETVTETAAEVVRTVEGADRYGYDRLKSIPWIVACSSGTVAAGVAKGLRQMYGATAPRLVLHLGYDRSVDELRSYVEKQSGVLSGCDEVVNEGYAYKDKAKPGPTPPWPCNEWYDLKAFRWWMRVRDEDIGAGRVPRRAVLWNIG